MPVLKNGEIKFKFKGQEITLKIEKGLNEILTKKIDYFLEELDYWDSITVDGVVYDVNIFEDDYTDSNITVYLTVLDIINFNTEYKAKLIF